MVLLASKVLYLNSIFNDWWVEQNRTRKFITISKRTHFQSSFYMNHMIKKTRYKIIDFRRLDGGLQESEITGQIPVISDRTKQSTRSSMFRKSRELSHPISVIEFCIFLRYFFDYIVKYMVLSQDSWLKKTVSRLIEKYTIL